MRSYGSSTDLISNHDTLQTHSHTDPVDRNHEIQRLKDALTPLQQGHKPANLAIHGPPGTGKSTCINQVLSQIDNNRITTAQINCATYSTRAAVLTRTLETLGYVSPKKGHAIDTKLSKLRQQVDRTNLAIALDELDKLQEPNDVIYDLYEAAAQADNYIAIILSCDVPPEEIGLEQRTMSRLQYQSIRFDPYSAGQIRDILHDRVERGFKRDAVADGVVDRIADHVANEKESGSGDIRCAIDLLRMAGQRAERECHPKVTRNDVEAVLNPGHH